MIKEIAEKIVRGITDKIECNTVDIDDWAEFWGFTREEYEEFLDMAIKALEQTELNSSYNGVNTELDCISREAVEKITWEEPSYTDALNVLTEVREKVRALPSVTPQHKMGRWIADVDKWGEIVTTVNGYRCSECNTFNTDKDNYCPNCGAKMEVEE